MRRNRNHETGRDRKALARDAGMGSVSTVSALAGALSGYGALAALLAITGLTVVAINGGKDFSTVSSSQFKDGVALIMVVATFLAFVFGGYTAGRMSRRSGAGNGAAAGIIGVIVAVGVVALVKFGGGGAGLSRVATHINVPSTWADWRSVAYLTGAISLVAMILGGVIGGTAGERWHAKLLARAADSAYGPEAEHLADAKRLEAEAAAAHAAAQERVTRSSAVASVSPVPGRPTVVEPASAERADQTAADQTAADQAAVQQTQAGPATAGETAVKPRRRHLLHH